VGKALSNPSKLCTTFLAKEAEISDPEKTELKFVKKSAKVK
jgi:hypothetical protein